MDMCHDPTHPMYYHVYKNTLPPEISYRIVPKKRELATHSLKEIKDKKYKRRYIFEGWNNYTPFE